MPTSESADARRLKVRGLLKNSSGIGLLLTILYFASIGPLAWLEVNGYGNRIFWQRLKVVYSPVYASWLYGPDWCGESIKRYLRNFSSRPGSSIRTYIFALPNEVQEEEILRALDALDLSRVPLDSNPISYPTEETWKRHEKQHWNRIERELAAERSKPSIPWLALSCVTVGIILSLGSVAILLREKRMSISQQAKEYYDLTLKDELEATHHGQFVAIEPTSKAFFLGDTPLAAALAAKEAFPDRKSFLLRIGHDAAFHIGGATR